MTWFKAACILCISVVLLAAAFSGFVDDARISSTRLGSDFTDSRFHQFDDLSVGRAEQRTRREEIGLETVSAIALLIAGWILFLPKRTGNPSIRRTMASAIPPLSQNVPTPERRRPDSKSLLKGS